MSNKLLSIEPGYLPNAVGNILNCAITSLAGVAGFTMTQPYLRLKHIRLMNTDSSAHTVSLYKGATGAQVGGTEFAWGSYSIPAKSYVDWYGDARFDAADFLTGKADAASVVTYNIEAEIAVS